MKERPISREAAVGNIALDIVLTLLTCGIYGLFWVARIFRVLNAFLGREKYSFWPWFFLTIITCGIYGLYTLYTVCVDIDAVRVEQGKAANPSFAVLNLILAVVGLSIVSQAIVQAEINSWFD